MPSRPPTFCAEGRGGTHSTDPAGFIQDLTEGKGFYAPATCPGSLRKQHLRGSSPSTPAPHPTPSSPRHSSFPSWRFQGSFPSLFTKTLLPGEPTFLGRRPKILVHIIRTSLPATGWVPWREGESDLRAWIGWGKEGTQDTKMKKGLTLCCRPSSPWEWAPHLHHPLPGGARALSLEPLPVWYWTIWYPFEREKIGANLILPYLTPYKNKFSMQRPQDERKTWKLLEEKSNIALWFEGKKDFLK